MKQGRIFGIVTIGVTLIGVFSFMPFPVAKLLIIALCVGLVVWLWREICGPEKEIPEEDSSTEAPPEFIGSENLENEMPVSIQSLTREYRQGQRKELDDILTHALLHSLHVIRKAIPCHTAGIFFVGKSDSVYLKVWNSDSEESIIPGAVISSGVGLVGLMVREPGMKKIENDISTDSRTLFYYNEDVGVKSLMGVPILMENSLRGIIVVDDRHQDRFSDADLAMLNEFAHMVGQLCLQSFLQLENRIDRERVSALKNMEKDFLDLLGVNEIVTRLAEITGQALDYNRLMIALKGSGMDAKVVLSEGEDAEFFSDYEFSMDEAGVVSLSMLKNVSIQREFDDDRYAPRFSPREKANTQMRSIAVEPLGSKAECIGAISIESRASNRYTKVDREILRNLTTAASVALEKAKTLETVQHLATRDGLTGLANHREFQNTLSSELRAASRYNNSLGLIMLDIDHFKKINDNYGHPAGDIVLKEVSKILQNNIRQGVDYVARYGGEEFSLIIDKADDQMIFETAERIRTLVEKTAVNVGIAKTINLTMSLGYAIHPIDAKSQKDLIDKADKALYKAKHTGRNQTIRA